MHHFPHHIGDYAAATAHLSFVEDAAYHRLLRLYYRDERPLPVEVAACQRLAGARSREERRAVEIILHEFFDLREDGWHQHRADREVGEYQARANVARENGKRSGGRPKTRKEPEDKPGNNQGGYSRDTQNEPSATLTVNQEPRTREDHDSVPNGTDKSPEVSFTTLIFGKGLSWLKENSGKSEPDCRSLLGKWRKQLGDEGLLTALGRAQREGALQPVSWMEATIRAQKLPDKPVRRLPPELM